MTYVKPPVTMPIPGPWPEREGRGGRSLSLDPITYVLPMKKKLLLAAVVVVLIAVGVFAGYKLHGEDASLRAKAKVLDHYCQGRYEMLSTSLAELARPERHDYAIGAIDSVLVDVDLRSLAICISDADRSRLPQVPWMCTKAFKNDDTCRAKALHQILDSFPPEHRYIHD